MAYDEQADAQQNPHSPYAQYKHVPLGLNLDKVSRATAQDAIRNRISEYRLAINQLEALSRALPNELPLPADEILRELVLGY